ncbi:hypothetical protein F4808DRAFT_231058 [Astrocystis sublimbata]|nr:hypothetical protein F4808DRAFT_231058 [Astrocystis sublimbata]
MDHSIRDEAQSLLSRIASECSNEGANGSTHVSFYDAAWLSILRKPTNGDRRWLFPQYFDWILKQQLPSGAWGPCVAPLDSILNTAAALLALQKHVEALPGNQEWVQRITKANNALTSMLAAQHGSAFDQVRFGLSIKQHIELLADNGILLENQRLQDLRLDYRSDPSPTSSWKDSKESRTDLPFVRALRLIHSSPWDEAAEIRLKDILECSRESLNEIVPSTWPFSCFVISSSLAVLSEADIHAGVYDSVALGTSLYEDIRKREESPDTKSNAYSDINTWAMVIGSLHDLGHCPGAEVLVAKFETCTGLMDLSDDQNSTFTTNCHVLICLLKLDGPKCIYFSQIKSILVLLTGEIYTGSISFNLNCSGMYCMMLLAKAFWLLCLRVDMLEMLFKLEPDLQEKIPIITLQLLARALLDQDPNGSWGNICEVTSYVILTLSSLVKLPWIRTIGIRSIEPAVARGKVFLLSKRDQWTYNGHLRPKGGSSYTSNTLSEAYCLAATLIRLTYDSDDLLSVEYPPPLPEILIRGMRKVGSLMSRTPLIAKLSNNVRQVAELQACYYTSLIKRREICKFPRSAKGEDKYQLVIPLAFILCMGISNGKSTGLQLLEEMMVLSNLNFLLDEYMEGTIEGMIDEDSSLLRDLVEDLFVSNEEQHEAKRFSMGQAKALSEVRDVLLGYVEFILQHHAVLDSPPCYRARLAAELKTFLLAHTTQIEDNHKFASQTLHGSDGDNMAQHTIGDEIDTGCNDYRAQGLLQFVNPQRTFYNWVRSTSADHTSCPFSFVFFNSLLYSTTPLCKTNLFGTSRTAYVAEDLCRHLSSLCRMYNDYGSIKRDAREGNLNSVNFPEFSSTSEGATSYRDQQTAKSELMWIAEYERRGLDIALAVLGDQFSITSRDYIMNGQEFFINVTDLFGQLYVLKDVGTRIK